MEPARELLGVLALLRRYVLVAPAEEVHRLPALALGLEDLHGEVVGIPEGLRLLGHAVDRLGQFSQGLVGLPELVVADAQVEVARGPALDVGQHLFEAGRGLGPALPLVMVPAVFELRRTGRTDAKKGHDRR